MDRAKEIARPNTWTSKLKYLDKRFNKENERHAEQKPEGGAIVCLSSING